MTHLYSNENFPFPVVEKLRQLGHDVLTMQDAGQTGQSMSDEAVLSFAQETGRILITLNRKHFIHLHNQKTEHSGIIVCTFDLTLKVWLIEFTKRSMSIQTFQDNLYVSTVLFHSRTKTL